MTTLTLETMKMKHQLRPSIEPLETKDLLSHVAMELTGIHGGKPVHRATGKATLTDTLTTNQASYTPGEVVRMTLIETNNTRKSITIGVGPSVDAFSITFGGKTIWRSQRGFMPEFIEREVLRPGQSLTLTAAWTAKSVLGAYVAHNQMPPAAIHADFSIAAKLG
jgi:hypothetical protein